MVRYKDAPQAKVKLPKRQSPHGYEEPAYEYKFIPEIF